MQRVEHRAGDVPVVIMGLQIERVAVSQQLGKPARDLGAILVADADIDIHNGVLCEPRS